MKNKPLSPEEILEKMANGLREMRDSDVNPCKDEDAVGLCPCHTFDKAIDSIEGLQALLSASKQQNK